MSSPSTAAARAAARVAEVRDDPHARFELCASIYDGPHGWSRRHLRFRRAALSFMRWQVSRGVLASLEAEVPGSRWWRAVNERLLRDGCEMVARSGGLGGAPSSETIELWMSFAAEPTARSWYRAHNASIVAAYLEHRDLAVQEGAVERFFLNVVLLRVLYAHSLVAAPRLSLGRFAPLGGLLGDPRLGMAGAFLSLSRILPARYPVIDDLHTYVDEENRLGRLLDYGVILPRLQLLYEWSAEVLGQPALVDLVRDGDPSYVAPSEAARFWRPAPAPVMVRLLGRLTRALPGAPGATRPRAPTRESSSTGPRDSAA
jgi:hypothetical protein